MFVATKYFCCNNTFVATSVLLSQQKTCFVMIALDAAITIHVHGIPDIPQGVNEILEREKEWVMGAVWC